MSGKTVTVELGLIIRVEHLWDYYVSHEVLAQASGEMAFSPFLGHTDPAICCTRL